MSDELENIEDIPTQEPKAASRVPLALTVLTGLVIVGGILISQNNDGDSNRNFPPPMPTLAESRNTILSFLLETHGSSVSELKRIEASTPLKHVIDLGITGIGRDAVKGDLVSAGMVIPLREYRAFREDESTFFSTLDQYSAAIDAFVIAYNLNPFYKINDTDFSMDEARIRGNLASAQRRISLVKSGELGTEEAELAQLGRAIWDINEITNTYDLLRSRVQEH